MFQILRLLADQQGRQRVLILRWHLTGGWNYDPDPEATAGPTRGIDYSGHQPKFTSDCNCHGHRVGLLEYPRNYFARKYRYDTSAAALADSYVSEFNGIEFGDWFLPSKDELNQIWVGLEGVGFLGESDFFYWSSSENGRGQRMGAVLWG
jgi:hypothetical protein